jgi:hypothetical protein
MTVWRSWFWNIALAFIAFGMAAIMTYVSLSRIGLSYNAINMAIFIPFSLFFWALSLRSLFLGVFVNQQRVVVRLTTRTVKIRWSEIESVAGSGPGPMGAVAGPSVTWSRAGKTRTTDLAVLGSYGLLGKGKPLGERAADDLTARLARWRKENAVSPA